MSLEAFINSPPEEAVVQIRAEQSHRITTPAEALARQLVSASRNEIYSLWIAHTENKADPLSTQTNNLAPRTDIDFGDSIGGITLGTGIINMNTLLINGRISINEMCEEWNRSINCLPLFNLKPKRNTEIILTNRDQRELMQAARQDISLGIFFSPEYKNKIVGDVRELVETIDTEGKYKHVLERYQEMAKPILEQIIYRISPENQILQLEESKEVFLALQNQKVNSLRNRDAHISPGQLLSTESLEPYLLNNPWPNYDSQSHVDTMKHLGRKPTE